MTTLGIGITLLVGLYSEEVPVTCPEETLLVDEVVFDLLLLLDLLDELLVVCLLAADLAFFIAASAIAAPR